MTPLERAEKIFLDEGCSPDEGYNARIAEKIRVAIVEATNEEVEKRRALEIAMAGSKAVFEDMAVGRLAAQSNFRAVKHVLADVRGELAEIAEMLA